jgi:hypothetical protein
MRTTSLDEPEARAAVWCGRQCSVGKRIRQVQRVRAGRRGAVTPSRLNMVVRALIRRVGVVGGRRLVFGALVGVVLVAALVVGVVLFGGGNRPPIPNARARVYEDFDACLLTGKDGIAAGTQGSAAWKGMQAASQRTHVRVSYAPVTGRQSAAAARPFLNSLFQRSCDVVVASGAPEVRAAVEGAGAHSHVRFVLVGQEEKAARNVVYVRPGAGLAAKVKDAVTRAVGPKGEKSK